MSAEALWQGAVTAHSEAATAIERAVENNPDPPATVEKRPDA